jgi:hypothetical protein
MLILYILYCTNQKKQQQLVFKTVISFSPEDGIMVPKRVGETPLISILIRIVHFLAQQPPPPSGPGPPHSQGFSITHNDAPQSVRLLLKSDRLVSENST